MAVRIDHDIVCARMGCAATLAQHAATCGPGLRLSWPASWVLCQSSSRKHSSADGIDGLFYHKNEAIHCDKCRDDELLCWNVPGWQFYFYDGNVHRNFFRISDQYNVIIACDACIVGVTIAQLLTLWNHVGSDLWWTVWLMVIKVIRRLKI